MNSDGPSLDLGIYRPSGSVGMTPATKVAIVVSIAWLGLCVLLLTFVGIGDGITIGPLRFALALLGAIVPLGFVWLAALVVGSAQAMREESERLQATMDAVRQLYMSQAQMASTAVAPNVEKKIEEIARGQRRAETALADLASNRALNAPQVSDAPTDQPTLGLEAPEDEAFSVTVEDFITAMNFPENADDKAGFDALRRALADRRAARLVTASQDVLTLLSQEGIYMDDLTPDHAKPDVWRRFGNGDRGGSIAAVGGIRDRAALSLASTRMRNDSIFRDACHHFLRTFDHVFSPAIDGLTDQELIQAVETRTARAFMLIGRVAGMFD